MKTMFLAQVNWVLLQVLLSSASELEAYGEGDTQDDQEDGGETAKDGGNDRAQQNDHDNVKMVF